MLKEYVVKEIWIMEECVMVGNSLTFHYSFSFPSELLGVPFIYLIVIFGCVIFYKRKIY